MKTWHSCVHLCGVTGSCPGAAVGSWSPHHADWSRHGRARPPGQAVLFLALGKHKGTGLILTWSSREKHRVVYPGIGAQKKPQVG